MLRDAAGKDNVKVTQLKSYTDTVKYRLQVLGLYNFIRAGLGWAYNCRGLHPDECIAEGHSN